MLLNADTVPHTVPYTVPQRMFLTLCALDDAHQTPCTYMVQTFEWLQAMLRISMAPGLPTGIELPQILCYDELETMDTMMWLGMQNVIIVNDRYAQADMHFALQHATCTMEEESLLSKVSPAHVMACKCYSIYSKKVVRSYSRTVVGRTVVQSYSRSYSRTALQVYTPSREGWLCLC
jgi:hypothetical protein